MLISGKKNSLERSFHPNLSRSSEVSEKILEIGLKYGLSSENLPQ